MAQPPYAQPPGYVGSINASELPPYNPVYLPQYSSFNQQPPAYVQGYSPPPAYQNAWSVQVNSFDPEQFQRQLVSTSLSAPVIPISTSSGYFLHNQQQHHVPNRPASEGCNCCPKKSQECNKSSCVVIVVLFVAVALCMLAAGAYGVYKATKN